MSTSVFPLAVWADGTLNNALPANDNSLRLQTILSGAISKSVTAQPGAPSNGDVYIIPAGATGLQWSTFAENDVVIFMSGGWYATVPVYGVRMIVNDVLEYFDGADWVAVGGGGSSRSTVTNVSSSSGVVTLNYALGDYFTLTLTENVTSWVISNPPGSGEGFTLMVQITQGAGSYTVAKPGTTAGGTALGVSTTNGDVDVLAISSFNNGTTLRSSIAKDFS